MISWAIKKTWVIIAVDKEVKIFDCAANKMVWISNWFGKIQTVKIQTEAQFIFRATLSSYTQFPVPMDGPDRYEVRRRILNCTHKPQAINPFSAGSK